MQGSGPRGAGMLVSPVDAAQLSAGWHERAHRQRFAMLALIAAVTSLLFAALVLATQFVSVVVLLISMVLVAVAWRPIVGLYITFGLVLLFEVGGPDPLMEPGRFLHYGLQSTLGLSGVIISPLEMLLLLCLLSWLARSAIQGRLDFRGGALGWPMLAFALSLLYGLVRGRMTGGDPYTGFWEIRALLYAAAAYLLATNLIRSRAQIVHLTNVGFTAMSLYAMEGTYRRLVLAESGELGDIKEFWYSHETVIFVSALIVLIVAQLAVGGPRWQRVIGPLVLPFAVFTMLASERRAGQIAMIVALLAAMAVFLIAQRRAFFLIAVPILLVGAIYLPVFWNNTGLLGQPARAVRSITNPDPRDAASNLWREMEKFNVRATIYAYPLSGIGFGTPFFQLIRVPDISHFPFWAHQPHHNVLWIWLKTGAVGFIVFWVVIGNGIARAAHLARVLHDPVLRSFAIFVLGGVFSALVFSYVDLGLNSGRVTVFLGVTLGTLAVLHSLDSPPVSAPTRPRQQQR
jgi:hypothetical protein